MHEITTPYGTVVREYVSPDGKVFGVAWRGPFLPNFQQLLGDSYGTFAQAAQEARSAQPRRSRNAPLTVEQPDLVMHSAGHMRAYVGHAYIPGMIPQGVDATGNKVREGTCEKSACVILISGLWFAVGCGGSSSNGTSSGSSNLPTPTTPSLRLRVATRLLLRAPRT